MRLRRQVKFYNSLYLYVRVSSYNCGGVKTQVFPKDARQNVTDATQRHSRHTFGAMLELSWGEVRVKHRLPDVPVS